MGEVAEPKGEVAPQGWYQPKPGLELCPAWPAVLLSAASCALEGQPGVIGSAFPL